MFSVIMPVHNKKEYVVAALESVLAQTYDKFELILIEDCSNDGSAELIRPYESENVKIYSRDAPGPGGYAARNFGVAKANYQWVTFLDADDFWYANHLQEAYNLINKYQCTDFFSFSREKTYKGKKSRYLHPVEEKIDCHTALERYSRIDIFHTNAIVVNRDLFFYAGGFPEGKCKRGGDSDLWLRLLLNCKGLVVSPVVTSCYALDNSDVIYSKSSVERIHPVRNTVISNIRKSSNKDSISNLKRLSNRKSISWLAARKRSGDFSIGELNVIYFNSLDFGSVKQLIKLLIPSSFGRSSATFFKKSPW